MSEEKKENTATEEIEQTKKCVKCKKDIGINYRKCPHCKSEQIPTKQKVVGCLVIIGIILLMGSCMSMCGGPPAMVDTSVSIESQRSQAEKLKLPAYTISKQFIKKQLKSPSSAKFEAFEDNMITWINGNEFTCSMNIESKNSFGVLLRSNFWAKIKYTGKDNWILIDIKQRK